jgi:hypothetical protein
MPTSGKGTWFYRGRLSELDSTGKEISPRHWGRSRLFEIHTNQMDLGEFIYLHLS